jgi:hypothetical protein
MNKREATFAICCIFSYVGLIAANLVIKKQDEKYAKLLKTAQLNHKVVEKFVEYSDLSISQRIRSEVEFDFMVMDL